MLLALRFFALLLARVGGAIPVISFAVSCEVNVPRYKITAIPKRSELCKGLLEQSAKQVNVYQKSGPRNLTIFVSISVG